MGIRTALESLLQQAARSNADAKLWLDAQHALDSSKPLCDYTEAEVSSEFYRRLCRNLGDPRVGVNANR
jgi:hypothetical protein